MRPARSIKAAARRAPWFPIALASTMTGMSNSPLLAQNVRDFMQEGSPYPALANPEPSRYNLKWGKLIARFHASATAEFNDNINLADHDPEMDLSYGPNFDVGFLWPITKANLLQLDIGVGYRWYLDHPSIQTVNVAPNSHVDYRVFFDHGQLNFHDNFSVQVDPTSRLDVSGSSSGDDVSNFRRINNAAGLTAEWRPVREWSLVSSYDFVLDRSLSGEFTSIDRDDHAFTASAYYDFSPRLTAGLSGSCTLTYYQENVQNDAISYSLGPVLILKPTQFITIDARAGYSISTFDSTGTINDSSDFRGITGQVGVRHALNRWVTHDLRFSKGRDLGYGSNFYDVLGVQYSVSARLHRNLTLDAKLRYEHFRASGSTDEVADRYNLLLGPEFQFARHWRFSAGYTFNVKESNLPQHDYIQNRLTLGLTRQF